MTTQEKCIFIIKEFQLSARQVGEAIGVSGSAASAKIKNENYNKFDEKDLENLRNFFVEKINKIIKNTV